MSTNNPHYEADPNAIEHRKEKGREVIIVKPRGLNIVWGGDDRYWHLPQSDGNPAELLQVNWLEVTGSVDIDPRKNYEVGFRVSLTPCAFGWGRSPIYIMIKRGKDGKPAWKKESLTTSNGTNDFFITKNVMKSDRENQGLAATKLYFGLYEVWNGKWKGGLKIHHVRVKEVSD